MTRPGGATDALPGWVWLPACLALAFVAVPLLGLVAGVPWRCLGAILTAPASLDALSLSMRTAAASTLLVVALGLPLALVLDRLRGPFGSVLRTIVLAPLVLPPVVSGLALLAAFGARGLLGPAVGGAVAYTTLAVVLAQAFVSLPYLVLALEGALRARDTRLEAMAATLGARPTRVLTHVTLPLVASSLVTGAVLALARAIGEFGATLTFAGSLQGVTRTLPLEIYLQREIDPGAALGLSLLLLAVAVAVVGAAYGRRSPGPRARGHRAVPHDGAPPAPVREPSAVRLAGARVDARGTDLTCDIAPGTLVAVTGPNGAGKSTLVALVAGTLRPDRGHVTIGGRDVTTVPAPRRRVGLVAQDGLLLPHLSALDNVAFGPRAHGMTRATARARAGAQLSALGIGDLAGRLPATLSGGQAARVALARALALDPDVLLLDEPFAALDADVAADVRAQVRRLHAERPVTTLLVTHSPDDVALADAVLRLEGGRVVEGRALGGRDVGA